MWNSHGTTPIMILYYKDIMVDWKSPLIWRIIRHLLLYMYIELCPISYVELIIIPRHCVGIKNYLWIRIAPTIGKYVKGMIKVLLLILISIMRKWSNLQINFNITKTHWPPENTNKFLILIFLISIKNKWHIQLRTIPSVHHWLCPTIKIPPRFIKFSEHYIHCFLNMSFPNINHADPLPSSIKNLPKFVPR